MTSVGEKIKVDLYVAKKLIRKQNAKELKRKWKRFIKEQERKNAEQRKQTEVQQGD